MLQLQPEEFAQQLKKPEGEIGKQIAQVMNESNRFICLKGYDSLTVKDNDVVLEIGFGNGALVDYLFEQASVQYFGVDFSKTMVEEAKALVQTSANKENVTFLEGTVSEIPFQDDFFDKLLTVNTLYFWPNVGTDFLELYRVLKPGGLVSVVIRPKDVIEGLPIAEFGFQLFEIEEVKEHLIQSGFTEVNCEQVSEPDMEWNNEKLKMGSLYFTALKPK